jgi:hypothetical protein
MGEFLPNLVGNREELKYRASILYRWDPRTDTIKPSTEDVSIYEKIGTHTGLTTDEVKDEIELKKNIIEWLVTNKIRQVDDVGKIMNRYYLDSDTVIDVVKNNKNPKKLLD